MKPRSVEPATLATAAADALKAQARLQADYLGSAHTSLALVAFWAWKGAAEDGSVVDQNAVADAVVGAVLALYEPALKNEASPFKQRLKEPGAWPEAVFSIVPAHSCVGQTLRAAAARSLLMRGAPILPRMFAALAGVTQSRIQALVRAGTLTTAPTRHLITRPGRRAKGDETRILAASAFGWLKTHGLAPAASTLGPTADE